MRKTGGDVKSQDPSFDPEFEEVGVSVVVSEHTESNILMDHKEVSGEDELQVLGVGHEIMDKA